MEKYLINKLKTNVSLVDDRIQIKPLASIPVAQTELEHEDVIDAIRRNWVEVSEVSVTAPETAQPKIEIQRSPLEGAKSPQELDAAPTTVVEETKEESPKQETAKRGRKTA